MDITWVYLDPVWRTKYETPQGFLVCNQVMEKFDLHLGNNIRKSKYDEYYHLCDSKQDCSMYTIKTEKQLKSLKESVLDEFKIQQKVASEIKLAPKIFAVWICHRVVYNQAYIIMENLNAFTITEQLADFAKNKKPFQKVIDYIVPKIMKAVIQMNDIGVIHRFLNNETILILANGQIRFIDFTNAIVVSKNDRIILNGQYKGEVVDALYSKYMDRIRFIGDVIYSYANLLYQVTNDEDDLLSDQQYDELTEKTVLKYAGITEKEYLEYEHIGEREEMSQNVNVQNMTMLNLLSGFYSNKGWTNESPMNTYASLRHSDYENQLYPLLKKTKYKEINGGKSVQIVSKELILVTIAKSLFINTESLKIIERRPSGDSDPNVVSRKSNSGYSLDHLLKSIHLEQNEFVSDFKVSSEESNQITLYATIGEYIRTKML